MKIKAVWLTALLLALDSICFAQSKTLTFKQYAASAENPKTIKVNNSANAKRTKQFARAMCLIIVCAKQLLNCKLTAVWRSSNAERLRL